MYPLLAFPQFKLLKQYINKQYKAVQVLSSTKCTAISTINGGPAFQQLALRHSPFRHFSKVLNAI